MFKKDEFYKYAIKHKGISSLNLHRYQSRFISSLTPYIIEERQLNVAQ
ncbi:MAG: ATP-dependent Clp protease proteolytic subunit, partial [Bacteroidetes bacterium]